MEQPKPVFVTACGIQLEDQPLRIGLEGLCVSIVSIRCLLSTFYFLIHIVAQIQVLFPLSSIELCRFLFFSHIPVR